MAWILALQKYMYSQALPSNCPLSPLRLGPEHCQVQRGLVLSRRADFGGCFAFSGNLHCILPHGYGQGKLKGLLHTQTGMVHCLAEGTSPVWGNKGQEGNRSAMLISMKLKMFSYHTLFVIFYLAHLLIIMQFIWLNCFRQIAGSLPESHKKNQTLPRVRDVS